MKLLSEEEVRGRHKVRRGVERRAGPERASGSGVDSLGQPGGMMTGFMSTCHLLLCGARDAPRSALYLLVSCDAAPSSA